MSLMFQPLKKYAEFSGRARRSEFWQFWLFLLIAELVFIIPIAAVGRLTGTGEPTGAAMGLMAVCSLFFLGMLIPSLAVAFRRLHDTDRSAWWLLISLIPFFGGLVLLVFYFLPGTPGPNRFGPDPKGGATDTIASVFS